MLLALVGLGCAVHQTAIYFRYFEWEEFLEPQEKLVSKKYESLKVSSTEVDLDAVDDPQNGWFDEVRASRLVDTVMAYNVGEVAAFEVEELVTTPRRKFVRFLEEAVSKPRYEPPGDPRMSNANSFHDLQGWIEWGWWQWPERGQRWRTGLWSHAMCQLAEDAVAIEEIRSLVEIRDRLVPRKIETALSVVELALIRNILQDTSKAFAVSLEQMGFEEEAKVHRIAVEALDGLKAFAYLRSPKDSERSAWLDEHSGKISQVTPATEMMAGRRFSEDELKPGKLAEVAHLNWRVTLQIFYSMGAGTAIFYLLSAIVSMRGQQRFRLAFSGACVAGSLAVVALYVVFRRIVPPEVVFEGRGMKEASFFLFAWSVLGAALLILFIILTWLLKRPREMRSRGEECRGVSYFLTVLLLSTCFFGVLTKGYYFEERYWIANNSLGLPTQNHVSALEEMCFKNIRDELSNCLPPVWTE